MEIPFGLDTKAGVQGLNYDRVEAVLSSVPKPHDAFEEYRVVYFKDSDGFNIQATSRDFESDTSAVAAFSSVYEDLYQKYGHSYGGDDRLDLFYDAGLLPMVNWLFDPKYDGGPKLIWIMLSVRLASEMHWTTNLSYTFRTEPNEHADNSL